MTSDWRFWHGGFPGLQVGDLILPPSISGNARQAKIAAEMVARHPAVDINAITSDDPSRDWVHFTPHRNVALAYAGSCRRDFGAGALYVVDPIGDVEIDPDMPVQGLRAHAARIACVYDPHVNISDRRAAMLHAAATAVERGTSTKQQMAVAIQFARRAQ